MSDKEPRAIQPFSIIKRRGSPTKARTQDGYEVEKQDWVVTENPFDPSEGKKQIIKVECMDYHDEHFVYLDPNTKAIGRWFAWCTCGSPAAIFEPGAYDTKNPVLACYFHAQFGRHVTGDGKAWS